MKSLTGVDLLGSAVISYKMKVYVLINRLNTVKDLLASLSILQEFFADFSPSKLVFANDLLPTPAHKNELS